MKVDQRLHAPPSCPLCILVFNFWKPQICLLLSSPSLEGSVFRPDIRAPFSFLYHLAASAEQRLETLGSQEEENGGSILFKCVTVSKALFWFCHVHFWKLKRTDERNKATHYGRSCWHFSKGCSSFPFTCRNNWHKLLSTIAMIRISKLAEFYTCILMEWPF